MSTTETANSCYTFITIQRTDPRWDLFAAVVNGICGDVNKNSNMCCEIVCKDAYMRQFVREQLLAQCPDWLGVAPGFVHETLVTENGKSVSRDLRWWEIHFASKNYVRVTETSLLPQEVA